MTMAVNTIFLALAICCLVSKSRAVDCADCVPYTAGSGTDCDDLKKYIGCTFLKDVAAECTVPATDLAELKTATCPTPPLEGVCKCEADYYKADLADTSTMCTALDGLKACIDGASTEDTCDGETKAELLQFITARKASKSCDTGTGGTECKPGDCKNFGSCPATEKLPCTCVDGFKGDKCETAPACKDGDCANEGTCASGDKLPCTCPTGFTGNKCESAGNLVAAAPGLLVTLLLAAIYL